MAHEQRSIHQANGWIEDDFKKKEIIWPAYIKACTKSNSHLIRMPIALVLSIIHDSGWDSRARHWECLHVTSFSSCTGWTTDFNYILNEIGLDFSHRFCFAPSRCEYHNSSINVVRSVRSNNWNYIFNHIFFPSYS